MKTRELQAAENRLADAAAKFFKAQRDELIPRLREFEGTFPTQESLREAPSESDMDRIWRAVEDATSGPLEDAIESAAEESMALGGASTARDVGLAASFNIANPAAVRYLEQLGARRVTGINRETRRQLAKLLAGAVEDGWSYSRTEKHIRDKFDGFSARAPQLHIGSRAELIAVTETAEAYGHSAALVADDLAANGIVTVKYWQTAGGDRVCIICEGNGAQDAVPQNEPFDSGDYREPAHPACRCAVAYRPVRNAPDPASALPNMGTLLPV